jgi:hypothetical protein
MSESDEAMVQAIADAFAEYLNDALKIDKVSGKTLMPAVVEVFGKSPTEDALFKEATLKEEFQRLPKALNQAIKTDQVVGNVLFETICHALDTVFQHGASEDDEMENVDDGLTGPEWVEQHLGAKLPETLKKAYRDGETDELEDTIVDEGDLYICVTEFNSLSAEGYRSVWPGTEGMLILAFDGSGNVYFAKPKEKFKHVYFFDHETAERWRVGLSVPGFIKKLREYKTANEE